MIIPEGVTKIGRWAFEDCTYLTSITIPGSVRVIGKCAFRNCRNLTIHAPTGSVAEKYAIENGIKFEATE